MSVHILFSVPCTGEFKSNDLKVCKTPIEGIYNQFAKKDVASFFFPLQYRLTSETVGHEFIELVELLSRDKIAKCPYSTAPSALTRDHIVRATGATKKGIPREVRRLSTDSYQ